MKLLTLLLALSVCALAQETEASSGFDLHATASFVAEASNVPERAPRTGSVIDAGFRLMLYPTWKLNRHWSFITALQVVSRPYYSADFGTQGHGVHGTVTQGYLSFTQASRNGSIVVKAGELTSAFGSFPLLYDDKDNALVQLPAQYGYYGGTATLAALAGVEVDAAFRKVDGRAQFVNSSPANPRSIFDKEQYGSWAGGIGYTILQGLRVGGSAYYGPYLDREYPFYKPIEGRPRSMPGSGLGLEAQYGRGHWNLRGELQRFAMTYGPVPTFHEHTGYVEALRAIGPAWYAAGRFGYLSADYAALQHSAEAVLGYRPGVHQIVKLSYSTTWRVSGTSDQTLAVQFVTTFRPLALARR